MPVIDLYRVSGAIVSVDSLVGVYVSNYSLCFTGREDEREVVCASCFCARLRLNELYQVYMKGVTDSVKRFSVKVHDSNFSVTFRRARGGWVLESFDPRDFDNYAYYCALES